MGAMNLTDVIQDARLTPGACRVILYVASLGDGWHEVSHSQWRALLNHPGDKKLASTLKLAREFDYLERRAGGRGHSPRYRLSPALSNALSVDSPADMTGLSETGEDSPVETAGLNGGGKDSPADSPDLSADSPADSAGLRGDSRGEKQSVSETEGEAGAVEAAREEEPELAPRAQALLERKSGQLNGCRGALRDYLDARVDPDRQYAYIRTLLGWFDGMDPSVFRKPNGRQVDEELRPSVVADALNDLAASDEAQMKRPAGDPANLRTKIQVRIAQREDPHVSRKRSRSRDDGSTGRGPSGGRRTREGLSGHLG